MKEKKKTAEDVVLWKCDPTPPKFHSGINHELLRRCEFRTKELTPSQAKPGEPNPEIPAVPVGKGAFIANNKPFP